MSGVEHPEASWVQVNLAPQPRSWPRLYEWLAGTAHDLLDGHTARAFCGFLAALTAAPEWFVREAGELCRAAGTALATRAEPERAVGDERERTASVSPRRAPASARSSSARPSASAEEPHPDGMTS
ncbi:hypothetical protein ACFU98_42940 [Streptomyces sp. NPDC057575]|uniref:hypothetical protein n=1 Tax=unclassified Streptomyces TaxID=2593676 RepID=UPI00367E6606